MIDVLFIRKFYC